MQMLELVDMSVWTKPCNGLMLPYGTLRSGSGREVLIGFYAERKFDDKAVIVVIINGRP